MSTPATPGALKTLTLQDTVRAAREGTGYNYYLTTGVRVYLAADLEARDKEIEELAEKIIAAGDEINRQWVVLEAQRLLATLKGRTA